MKLVAKSVNKVAIWSSRVWMVFDLLGPSRTSVFVRPQNEPYDHAVHHRVAEFEVPVQRC
jgi:hypothetical protein